MAAPMVACAARGGVEAVQRLSGHPPAAFWTLEEHLPANELVEQA
ncbi:hypothetical protein [Streptomyces sp. NPDC002328]